MLAFGGVFVVASIGMRMKNEEWLRRAGPFEISEGTLGQAKGETAFWRQAAHSSEAETDRLQDRLRQTEELIGNLKRP
ncbi:MAG TPA: hypothetical protein VFX44_06170 [Solirubrobacterales bacterium]|nr:hypothetical protein [Solirubrobacterales bacterium]